ncbi:MAG: hypothetical protein JNJ93_13390, partial [Acinetobacter sp.]|nr:hypothetical protein [Acinetobacter sp.]
MQVKPIILQALLNFNLFCVHAGDYPPAETADEASACTAALAGAFQRGIPACLLASRLKQRIGAAVRITAIEQADQLLLLLLVQLLLYLQQH